MTDRGSPVTQPEVSSSDPSASRPHADADADADGAQDYAQGTVGVRQDSSPFLIRLARFLPRAIVIVIMVLAGLFLVTAVYPFIGARGRDLLNGTWSRWLARVCGVRVIVRGQPLMQGAVLVVANHVSWLDIIVINAVRPTAFIAKSEIRRWPLVGWLVAGAGTLFIERGRRHAVHIVGQAMQARFANGEAVGLFPEGTTTEGFSLLPFHGSLFEPARPAHVAIQPVALRFLRHGRRDSFAAFVGEETLVGNLWRILGADGLAVEMVYRPALPSYGDGGDIPRRMELAAMARASIQEGLAGMPGGADSTGG